VRKTAYCAFAFTVLSAAASIVPFLWWGIPYLLMIGAVDLLLLAAAYRTLACTTPDCVRKSGASSLLKYGMFASLVVFTVSALFLS
jgi:geranylgeranylglycerol-phosphate geranylgeranyltransferase